MRRSCSVLHERTGPGPVASLRPRRSARLDVGRRAPDCGAPAPRRPEACECGIRLGAPRACVLDLLGPRPGPIACPARLRWRPGRPVSALRPMAVATLAGVRAAEVAAPRIRGAGLLGGSTGPAAGEPSALLTVPTPALEGERFRRATRECLLAVAAVRAAVADAGLA